MADLTDPEVKKAIKEAVDAAVEEATAGLTEKNKELLAKLKKAQKDATIDPADHAALQQELSDTQAKLAEAQKLAKTAQAEAEKSKKAHEAESKVTHQLLVKNGLTSALVAAKVKPELMKAAEAMLSGQVQIIADGENRVAKVGDKALADFVADWAKSDEGKHFVLAPSNGGGGGQGGGNGGAQAKTMARAAFEALDPTAKMTFTKDGGTLTAG